METGLPLKTSLPLTEVTCDSVSGRQMYFLKLGVRSLFMFRIIVLGRDSPICKNYSYLGFLTRFLTG
jgi:hypothetical protein